MNNIVTLRMNATQTKQLETVKEALGTTVSTKAIFTLIGERTQLKIDMSQDKALIYKLQSEIEHYQKVSRALYESHQGLKQLIEEYEIGKLPF